MKNKLNMHNDHVASCYCCDYFRFDLGEPDISDITPGYDGHFRCIKHIYDYSDGIDDSQLHQVMENARFCSFFKPRIIK